MISFVNKDKIHEYSKTLKEGSDIYSTLIKDICKASKGELNKQILHGYKSKHLDSVVKFCSIYCDLMDYFIELGVIKYKYVAIRDGLVVESVDNITDFSSRVFDNDIIEIFWEKLI